MDISVIIPVYNVEQYIEKSIRSIFNQTKSDGVEFIIINDATPDLSMSIVRNIALEYPSLNIRLVDMETNSGSATVRQKGIDIATGEYFINFDSDDWCEPNMLEELYKVAKNNDADIVISDYFSNYKKGNQLYHAQKSAKNGKESAKMLLDGRLHGSLWNKLIKSSLWEDNNIEFAQKINLWEDLIVTTQLCYFAKTVLFIPKAFLHYNQTNTYSYCYNMSLKSLANIESAIDVLHLFFSDKTDNILFEESLIERKLIAKSLLVRYTRGDIRKVNSSKYSEIDNKIMSSKFLPCYHKLALWFAVNKCQFITSLIYSLINVTKKLTNK